MTVNPFNVNRLYVIDLFVNGVHSKEEYREDEPENRHIQCGEIDRQLMKGGVE